MDTFPKGGLTAWRECTEPETTAGLCWRCGALGQKHIHRSVPWQRKPHGFGLHILWKVNENGEVRREQERKCKELQD